MAMNADTDLTAALSPDNVALTLHTSPAEAQAAWARQLDGHDVGGARLGAGDLDWLHDLPVR
jgi:hypothetical protein